MECHLPDRDLESTSVITYTGDTATHAVAHTVVTFKTGVHDSTDGVTDRKYIGSCPADLKPGMARPAPICPSIAPPFLASYSAFCS
jgi:hypothetical protein